MQPTRRTHGSAAEWRPRRESVVAKMATAGAEGGDPPEHYRVPAGPQGDDKSIFAASMEGYMRTIRRSRLPSRSSWSRNDHEDGGPTIQVPTAEFAAPLASIRVQRITHHGKTDRRLICGRGSKVDPIGADSDRPAHHVKKVFRRVGRRHRFARMGRGIFSSASHPLWWWGPP
jgi:hypothetical protein